MPRIHTIGSMEIVIYFDDHPPVHVHAIAGRDKAKIAMEDARVVWSYLAPKQLRIARRWVLDNPALIAAKWKLFVERN